MQAYIVAQYGGPESAALADIPTPEPGAGEVRIAVHAAGVNPVDWKMRAGNLRTYLPLDLPVVLGSELAGVVDAVGPDVTEFAVGDAVFAPSGMHGAFAEYAVVTAAVVIRKPESVSFTDAAALPIAGGTAPVAVEKVGLKAGQTLLVNGAGGGVGGLVVQLARRQGITVIGTASPAKQSLITDLGATHVAYGDGVSDRVRALFPDGVDGIIDLVGGDSLRAVAGLVADPTRIISVSDGATATELGGGGMAAESTPARLAPLAALVGEGSVSPRVSQTYPLADASLALAAVEGRHANGKIVITIR